MDKKQPCFVVGISKPPKRRVGEKEHRKGEHTFVAALIEIKPNKHIEVPDAIAPMLKRFEDVMPPKVFKGVF